MEKTYTFEELIEIIAALRGENGCPWDRKQTHGSLRTCMIEEAYEVVEGIRILEEKGSWDNLCEELGDVLLQVVLHSQIAKEEGLFTIDEVICGISEKMVRRHPHVFGDRRAAGAEDVVLNWEEIKKQEKKNPEVSEVEAVPRSFPALIRTSKVQKKLEAEKQLFADEQESFSKARDILQLLESGESSEELVGQLLMEVCNISRKRNVHAEQALADCLEKLIKENV